MYIFIIYIVSERLVMIKKHVKLYINQFNLVQVLPNPGSIKLFQVTDGSMFVDYPQVINHRCGIPELNGGFGGKINEPKAMIV